LILFTDRASVLYGIIWWLNRLWSLIGRLIDKVLSYIYLIVNLTEKSILILKWIQFVLFLKARKIYGKIKENQIIIQYGLTWLYLLTSSFSHHFWLFCNTTEKEMSRIQKSVEIIFRSGQAETQICAVFDTFYCVTLFIALALCRCVDYWERGT
jgi:hypothetical protein